jgi:glycosyltransferase involved in cell wall biosynthesis
MAASMKILHILYSGLGGHGSIFSSFINNERKPGLENSALFNGIEPVRPGYITACTEHDIPWNFVSKKKGLDPGYYRRMYKLIKTSDADIVFLHNSGYILPARIANLFSKKKKKIVVRETQANHLKTKMDWFWLKKGMRWADQIVFLSEEYRIEILAAIKNIYNPKKITVIPNGIDLYRFKPLLAENSRQFKIGMQSRLVPIKDHITLLEAFARLKKEIDDRSFSLELAGDGECVEALKRKANELGIHDSVKFRGMIAEDALPAFLNELNIYVHASLGETMSTAIMQAMACGLPIIASDVKGINNMISNEVNGLLVQPKDVEALAIKIASLVNDPDKRTKIASEARAYAEKLFSDQRMLNEYRDLFSALQTGNR